MKNFLVGILFFKIGVVSAQVMKVNIDNPEPRVGQSVRLTVNMSFLNDYIKSRISDSVEFKHTNKDYLERTFIPTKVGKISIEPIELEFGCKKYKSEKIVLNVIEALPDAEGIWIRHFEKDGKDCIIIEQNMLMKPNQGTLTAEEWKQAWSEKIGMLAILKGNEDMGIKFHELFSSYAPAKPNQYTGENVFKSLKFFVAIKGLQYAGPYRISKEDFEKLPDATKIPVITFK